MSDEERLQAARAVIELATDADGVLHVDAEVERAALEILIYTPTPNFYGMQTRYAG